METKNVFLDTTEFDGNSLNYESKKFKSLLETIRDGKIKVFISDVVEGEIINHIKKYSKEVIKDIQKFNAASYTRFVKHLTNPPINQFLNLQKNQIEDALIKQFEDFKKSSKLVIIPTNTVKANEILELYFNKKPPFGENEKKEFPDAISLLALLNWCQKHGQKIYVISENKDFRFFCDNYEQLLYLPDLSDFLEIFSEYKKKNTKLLHNFISENIRKIDDDIRQGFEKIELVSDDYDADAIFSDQKVDDVEILSWHIIYSENNFLLLEITANVSFSATVSQNDYTTAAYDNEDSRYFFVERNEFSIDETEYLEISLEYSYFGEVPKVWEDLIFQSINIKPDTIELDLNEYL